jgi:peroxiredoxin
MPSIQSLYNDVDQEKIAFVMLSLDQDNQSRKIARYIAKQNYTFPVFQPATPLPESLRVTTIPTTFIISPDGKIKYKHVGLANYDTKEMREFLEKL